MLISVLNIKLTCEWHKDIKLNYKNTFTLVIVVLKFPSTIHDKWMPSTDVTCSYMFRLYKCSLHQAVYGNLYRKIIKICSIPVCNVLHCYRLPLQFHCNTAVIIRCDEVQVVLTRRLGVLCVCVLAHRCAVSVDSWGETDGTTQRSFINAQNGLLSSLDNGERIVRLSIDPPQGSAHCHTR